MSHYEVTLLLWYELSEMAKDTIVKIVELPRKEKKRQHFREDDGL